MATRSDNGKETLTKENSRPIKSGLKFFFAPLLSPIPPFVPYSPFTTVLLFLGWRFFKNKGINRLFT